MGPESWDQRVGTNKSRAAMQCLRNASPSPGPRCSAWAARRDSASGTPRPAKGCATVSQERLAQRSREAKQCLGNSSPSQVPQATRQCLGNVVPTQDAVPRERLAQPRAARQCLVDASPSPGPRGSVSGTPHPATGREAVPPERFAQRTEPRGSARERPAQSRAVEQCLGNASRAKGARERFVQPGAATPRERLAQPRAARQCPGNAHPAHGREVTQYRSLEI